MEGILLSFITTFSWTIGIFPFTKASQLLGANSVNHFRLFLSVLVLSILLILVFGISPAELFTKLNYHHWIWLGLSGVIGLSVGDFFSFSAFVYLGPGLGSIFATLAPAVALVSGILLLNEKINLTGILGMIITVLGVFIILASNNKTKELNGNPNLKKGLLFGFLSAVCQGVGIVFAKKGLSHPVSILPMHATWIRMMGATISMYSISILAGNFSHLTRPIVQNKDGGVKYLLLGTLFGPVIGVTMSLYTVKLIEASIAQTIFSLVPVFVIIISALFYKQKIKPQVYTGLFVALIGVFILVWRDKF